MSVHCYGGIRAPHTSGLVSKVRYGRAGAGADRKERHAYYYHGEGSDVEVYCRIAYRPSSSPDLWFGGTISQNALSSRFGVPYHSGIEGAVRSEIVRDKLDIEVGVAIFRKLG